eukprot:657709-Rhodomonas_salina.1
MHQGQERMLSAASTCVSERESQQTQQADLAPTCTGAAHLDLLGQDTLGHSHAAPPRPASPPSPPPRGLLPTGQGSGCGVWGLGLGEVDQGEDIGTDNEGRARTWQVEVEDRAGGLRAAADKALLHAAQPRARETRAHTLHRPERRVGHFAENETRLCDSDDGQLRTSCGVGQSGAI